MNSKISDKTATANSPNFNQRNWVASREALAFSNRPKSLLAQTNAALATQQTVCKNKVKITKGKNLDATVDRLKASQFDVKVETQKVVNLDAVAATARKRAELLGCTVKVLRTRAKKAGKVRYSKLAKAALVDMLL